MGEEVVPVVYNSESPGSFTISIAEVTADIVITATASITTRKTSTKLANGPYEAGVLGGDGYVNVTIDDIALSLDADDALEIPAGDTVLIQANGAFCVTPPPDDYVGELSIAFDYLPAGTTLGFVTTDPVTQESTTLTYTKHDSTIRLTCTGKQVKDGIKMTVTGSNSTLVGPPGAQGIVWNFQYLAIQ